MKLIPNKIYTNWHYMKWIIPNETDPSILTSKMDSKRLGVASFVDEVGAAERILRLLYKDERNRCAEALFDVAPNRMIEKLVKFCKNWARLCSYVAASENFVPLVAGGSEHNKEINTNSKQVFYNNQLYCWNRICKIIFIFN